MITVNCPIRVAAAAAAFIAVIALAACGGSHATPPIRAGDIKVTPVRVLATPALGRAVRLPARAWAISFDARLPPGSRLTIALGGSRIELAGLGGELRVTGSHGDVQRIRRPAGWLGGDAWHLEATHAHLAIDGLGVPVRAGTASTISFQAQAGRPRVDSLIATPSAGSGLLLLHRLAELHARIPSGRFPEGATIGDRIVYHTNYWTSGFWPGALWQAAAVAPGDGMFASWALAATLEHLGYEHSNTHDVGFMYGQSSLAAWDAVCHGRARAHPASCHRLAQSVLSAAGELLTLAASNARAGAIPTNATSHHADTIIDSVMNIAILPWASRVTGNPVYRRVASRHAHAVARLLVRADGSTAQAVYVDRSTGRVLSIGTHQGLSASSTWSRGQGWAVYGFAQAAAALHDPALLRVAVRAADYVARHLPAGAVPLWDYQAPSDAPVDVSAGVITASGLLHLAGACRALPGVCSDQATRWSALGRRMLAAALGRASAEPPLGLLGSQVLNEHGRGCWCNGGELIFGLSYALEGLRLADQRR
jgi:unsaturated chondroitin disaccharide hydrolase